jgi:hypothetical protein
LKGYSFLFVFYGVALTTALYPTVPLIALSYANTVMPMSVIRNTFFSVCKIVKMGLRTSYHQIQGSIVCIL